MSWSVSAVGKAEAVAKEISIQFAKSGKCMEPEETIKNAVAGTIAVALQAQDPQIAVKVQASGSMGYKNWKDHAGCGNSLNITIEPMFNFVE